MVNKNRGGATNIKYIPDGKKITEIPGVGEFKKTLANLTKSKDKLEERVIYLEEKMKALEKFIGVKEESGDIPEKEEP